AVAVHVAPGDHAGLAAERGRPQAVAPGRRVRQRLFDLQAAARLDARRHAAVGLIAVAVVALLGPIDERVAAARAWHTRLGAAAVGGVIVGRAVVTDLDARAHEAVAAGRRLARDAAVGVVVIAV